MIFTFKEPMRFLLIIEHTNQRACHGDRMVKMAEKNIRTFKELTTQQMDRHY